MNLATMRTEARLLIGQPDTTNSDFTQAQLTAWANEAYSIACTRLESVPIATSSYTTAATIALDANTVKVNLAKWKSQPDNKWVDLAIGDLSDLFNRDPDWENATAGVPDSLYRDGTFALIPYPPPNAANLAQANGLKTYGLEIPAALSADADIPDLPVNVTDLFQHYIAYKAFLRLKMKEDATDQLVIFNSGLKSAKNVSTKFSDNKGWTWHESDPGARDWDS